MVFSGARCTRRAFVPIGVFVTVVAAPLAPAHAAPPATVPQSANLLSAAQAGFEGDTGNWNAPGGTVALATSPTHGGSGALAVTATSAVPTLVAVSGSGPTTFTPVASGARYTARLWSTAKSASRPVAAAVVFFDSAGRTLATAT